MSTWIDSINNGMTIAIVYGILLFIPFMTGSILLKSGKFNIAKCVLNTLFFVYICCLFSLVFLSLPTIGAWITSKCAFLPELEMFERRIFHIEHKKRKVMS